MVSLTSFEILPLDMANEQELQSHFSFIHNASDVVPEANHGDSVSSDIDREELNHRLEELITENETLKGKIVHNNKMMQELLNTISSWQKLMAETNSKHRTMLTTAVEENQALQTENKRLSDMVEHLELSVKESENAQTVLRNRLEVLEKEFMGVTTEKEKLNEEMVCQLQKHKELEEEVKRLTAQLGSLQEKCELLVEQEKQTYGSFLPQKEMTSCEDLDIVDDDDDASGYSVIIHGARNTLNSDSNTIDYTSQLEVELTKSKVHHLTGQLEEEKHMIKNLMQLLAEKDEEVQSLKQAQRQMRLEHEAAAVSKEKELLDVNEKLTSTISAMEKCKSKADFSIDQIANLEQKVQITEELLSVEKVLHETSNKALSEAEQKLRNLNEDKEKMSLMFEQHMSEQLKKVEEMSMSEAQLEQQNLVKLDGMTAKVFYLEEQLEAERQNVLRLTRQLTNNDGESESVRVLQSQVDMYKSNCECEKLARLGAQEEVEKLTQMVKTLQKQLEEQADLYLENHAGNKAHSSRRGKRHSNGTASEPEIRAHQNNHSAKQSDISCPCCSAVYSTYIDLERHVMQCIEKTTD